MNIYDIDWNPLSLGEIDTEAGFLLTTQKKTVIKPAYEKIVVWDETRGLTRIITVPEEASYEDCQQYIPYSDEELIYQYENKLCESDYVTAKLTEAFVAGDMDLLNEYKTKYSGILEQRKVWRKKIDELQNKVSADEQSI